MSDVIGLAGYARAGKDTVAAMLAERGYRRVAFADALRDVLLDTDPFVYVDCGTTQIRLSTMVAESGWDTTKARPEVRRLLQALGCGMRNAQPGVWVNIGMRRVGELLEQGHRVVITDVRFPDEADAIKGSASRFVGIDGGLVWRVNRHGYGPVNGHQSETMLDHYPFDWHVWNTGTLDELREQILRAM